MRRILTLVILAVTAARVSAGFKDGVFTSAEHKARFKLPKDWKLQDSDGENGKVALFESADGEMKGAFRHTKDGLGAAKHAKWRSTEWEKKGAAVTWDSEEKPKGREGDWLEVRLDLEAGPEEFKSAHVFFSKGQDDYELAVMVKAAGWEGAEKAIVEVLASLEFGEFKEEPGAEKEVLLPNPWQGCGKGSWAKYRRVSEAEGKKTEIEILMTLVEVEAEAFTVRTDTVLDGKTTPGEDQRVSLRQKSPAADAPKPEVGEEKVTVARGEFACGWEKTKSEQGWSQVWSCAEVPGGTVKSVSETGGTKLLMELVDFEKK